MNQIAATLDKRCASFEAALRAAPQDEEFNQCHQPLTSC
jgi:hypothetical protein